MEATLLVLSILSVPYSDCKIRLDNCNNSFLSEKEVECALKVFKEKHNLYCVFWQPEIVVHCSEKILVSDEGQVVGETKLDGRIWLHGQPWPEPVHTLIHELVHFVGGNTKANHNHKMPLFSNPSQWTFEGPSLEDKIQTEYVNRCGL